MENINNIMQNKITLNTSYPIEFSNLFIMSSVLETGPRFKKNAQFKEIDSEFSFDKFLVDLNKFDPKLEITAHIAGRTLNTYLITYNNKETKSFIVIKYRSNTKLLASNISIQYFGGDITYSSKYYDTLILFISKYLAPFQVPIPDPKIVKVDFVHMDGRTQKATIITRKIECPVWEEIRNNYPYTQKEIEALFSLKNPETIGKFIFWSGVTGGGKTYCLRALLQKWKEETHAIYITDPENFFNNSTYMHDILFLEDKNNSPIFYNEEYDDDDDDDDDESSYNSSQQTKLKLFIIEDGLDFILRDSRAYQGEAMSRLLNLTDGILGQGLKHLFIITSNEIVERIDKAFLRPGRILQNLEFNPFKYEDAYRWIKRNTLTYYTDYAIKDYTLSELYEIKNESLFSHDFKGTKVTKGKKIGII